MKVEVDALQFTTPYQGRETPAYLDLYASETFTNEDNEIIVGGNIRKNRKWHRRVVVTVNDGIVQSEPFEGDNAIDSTDVNGADTGVRYSLYLTNSKGKPLATIYEDLRVDSTSANPTTFSDINNASQEQRTFQGEVYARQSWVQSLFASFVSLTAKATTLIYGAIKLDYAATVLSEPTAVSITSPRLTKVLSADYDNDLQEALNAISDPTILAIKENTEAHDDLVIPSTVILDFQAGAKIFNDGGSIEFEGIGLFNPMSKIPVFSGFAQGEVTWSGSARPSEISYELWDTGSDSLSDRVALADSAFPGLPVKIHAYPRTIDFWCRLTQYHSLYFNDGAYDNELDTFGEAEEENRQPAFLLDSDTHVDGSNLAFIHESPNEDNTWMFYAYPMRNGGNFTDVVENIVVENLNFIGNELGSNPSGQQSLIHLGNCHNSFVRFNKFDRTHGYPVIMGGFSGEAGTYSYNSHIHYNLFVGIGTQVASNLNGKNCSISNNFFDQTETNGNSIYQVIDIEPNDPTSIIENIFIEDNIIDCTNETVGEKYVNGIAVQGKATNNPKGIFVRRNTILGMDYDRVIAGGDGASYPLYIGIETSGGQDVTVEDNYVRGAVGKAYTHNNNRFLKFKRNGAEFCGDASAVSAETRCAVNLAGAADAIVTDNSFPERGVGYDGTGIQETELEMPFTSSGSTVIMHTSSTVVPYTFWEGLTVNANGADYVVDTVALDTQNPSPQENFTLTSAIGTLAVQTVASVSGVDTGTDTITTPSNHNLNNGARLKYIAGTSAIGGLTDGATVFVINKTSATFQVSLTEGGSAINLTGTGTGDQTFVPVLRTKFSSATYSDNLAPNGIFKEPTGTSVDLDAELITALANKQTLDADLTTIAELTPSNGDFLIRVSGAWANRTVAQAKTLLAIVAADISDFAANVRSAVLTGLSTATSTAVSAADSVLVAIGKLQAQVTLRETAANKDATGGYAGLTLFKINFKNAANTFTSFFTNTNTAARTYTFQDRDGTIADNTDLALKQDATKSVNAQAGTTYSFQVSDNGKIVTLTNGSGITATVPAGLGSGFHCVVIQGGAGQVVFAASGTTINNRQSHTKIAGQYGRVTLEAYAANTFALAGDTAA